nr:ubiquitin-like protein ATG12 [Kwoniella shandongensis]KAA5526015.1 ubiquitin-like protein ATG12 [Kwoniella shandongensis]
MSSIPTPALMSPAIPDQTTDPLLASSQTIQPDALTALQQYKKKDATKVVVRFKSIGSAPIMKNNVFKATAGHKFQAVILFLRQQLGIKKEESLVCPLFYPAVPLPVMRR